MPLLPMFNNPVPLNKPKEKYLKGYCVVGMNTITTEDDEIWPEEFCSIPKMGDFVRSDKGNTLKVIQVTHIMRDEPTFELLLGRDTTSQSEVGF